MTHPLDTLLESFPVPFKPRQDQYEDFLKLIQWKREGVYLPVGGGKTFTSTMVAFYAAEVQDRVDQIIVICPPILIPQWAGWMESFPGVEVVKYRGTPSQREALRLDATVTIMTSGILKNDFEKLLAYYYDKRVFIIVDEATIIRNIATLAHKAFRDLINTGNKMFSLLTGTTISSPFQAYGYISLISPGVYRDYLQFETIHVRGVDQYKQPNDFHNLDMLARNMMLQAVRREADEIMDLPDVTYAPIRYELTPKHKQLYDKVVNELLVELDDGAILDGLTPGKLRMTSQRVILMPSEFGGESIRPEGLGLIDSMADELGTEKFMIFCNFNSSCEAVFHYCEKAGLNPVIVYGGPLSSSARNLKSVEHFKADKKCRVLVGHPKSCGVGVDGLQHITRAMLFLELPSPDLFEQAVGRIKREGQKSNCIVKIAVAIGTIQVDLERNKIKKEDWVQQVVPTKETLRKALRGG